MPFKSGEVDNQILKELQEIKKLLGLQKEMLTLEEFCVYTGISKSHVYHLISSGKIEFYKPFGKLIFFEKETVIEMLKQNPFTSEANKQNKVAKYLMK